LLNKTLKSRASVLGNASSMALRQRVLTAGAWTLFGHGLAQGVRLGGNLVTTRLLAPEAFGLMAMATVIVLGLSLVTDIGLRQNIVQNRQGDDPDFLNTAWVTQIARGLLIYVMALLISGLLSQLNQAGFFARGTVYADPALPHIAAAVAVTLLIAGFDSTKLATADRHFAAARVIALELTSQLVGLLTALSLAYVYRSVWALVAAAIVATVTKMLLSHRILPGTNNYFQWRPRYFRQLVRFGRWIFLTSLLGFLANNADRLFLGAVFDAEVLGQFAIAVLILGAVHETFSKLLTSVSYPALSEVARDRPHHLKAIYYRFRTPCDCVALFLAGFLFAYGERLITLLYDARYAEAGWILSIISLSLIFVRYGLATQCFIAIGSPHLVSYILILRLISICILLPVGFYFGGLQGVVLSIPASMVPGAALQLYFTRKLRLLDFRGEVVTLPAIPFGALIGYLVTELGF